MEKIKVPKYNDVNHIMRNGILVIKEMVDSMKDLINCIDHRLEGMDEALRLLKRGEKEENER